MTVKLKYKDSAKMVDIVMKMSYKSAGCRKSSTGKAYFMK